MKGEWADVNINEVFMTIVVSASIGLTRMLYLLRRGRRFVWFDAILEPCLAIIAGMMVWGVAEITGAPGILKSVLSSLGAWGGPKTIHMLELKYLGGRRVTDSTPVDIDISER